MSAGTDVRDRYRSLANRLRAIPGRRFGLRPYSVAIVTHAWSGAELGQGTETVVTTVLEESGQPPHVRWLSDEELAIAGIASATIEVGPITPSFPGGGTTWATLAQSALAANTELFLVLTGPAFSSGAEFRITDLRSDRALQYLIRAQKVGDDS